MVIGPPGVLTPGFKRPRCPLPLQLLGQGRRQAGGLLRVLERLIQFRELGPERGTSVLGPTVKLVHLGVEPVAVAGRGLLQQHLAAALLGGVQRGSGRGGDAAGRLLLCRQVEEPAAWRLVQRHAVIGAAGKDEPIFRLQGPGGEARADQPAALTHQRL